jgi:hypothetical protein
MDVQRFTSIYGTQLGVKKFLMKKVKAVNLKKLITQNMKTILIVTRESITKAKTVVDYLTTRLLKTQL